MRFRFWMVGKVFFVFVSILALAWIVMSLWNWVMPALFAGAHMIDYTHAIGLLVLSRVLFGGFRGHGGWGGRWGGHWGHRQWRRWEQMTPEEREKFEQGMHAMCGRGRMRDRRDRTEENGPMSTGR